MMMLLKPGLLTTLGVMFFLIGFVTVLSAIGSLRTTGSVPWLFFGYAGLNVALGFGLCMRERWVLYAFGLNLAGYTLLHLITLLSGHAFDSLRASVNILLALAVWGLVWSLRRYLTESAWGRLQGVLFLVLWVAVYVYSFVNTLM